MLPTVSNRLSTAIESVVLTIPQLQHVLGGDPPATLEGAFAVYHPESAEMRAWYAWRAACALRDAWEDERPRPEPAPREQSVGSGTWQPEGKTTC